MSILMVTVGVSIMSQIMTNGRHQKTETIKLIELKVLSKFTSGKEIVSHLHYISSMNIIVIFNRSFIRFKDFSKERSKLFLVN